MEGAHLRLVKLPADPADSIWMIANGNDDTDIQRTALSTLFSNVEAARNSAGDWGENFPCAVFIMASIAWQHRHGKTVVSKYNWLRWTKTNKQTNKLTN